MGNNIVDTNDENLVVEQEKLTPVEYLIQKINGSGIPLHLSKEQMKEILETGRKVQKMAVKYGTNKDIQMDNEDSFNGYGTYVVSVNEDNARQLGIKIASRKYGGTFYINNQPLLDFLQEKKFSPYWSNLISGYKNNSVDNLSHEILSADVKGNASLEREQNTLSTLLSLDLVEYKREQTFLYSVNIPDNDNTNYLLYNSPIGIENATKINGQLEKLGTSWRVSRNDIGKSVYFDTLSKHVFEGNQKKSSEFLKSIGYVGMQMDNANYIVFSYRDMSITDRVQFMKDVNGEVYGFTFEGQIYADEELVNSNVLAHEYTHIWDKYVQNNNPELWRHGKDILKGTKLWQEITGDKNYENLKTDDEILSECHARIVGKMAERILEKIEREDGGLTRDRVIDWDKEVSQYIAEEFNIKSEHGSESYVSDSVKAEYLKDFLSKPMKDLMNEVGFEKAVIRKNNFLKINNENQVLEQLEEYLIKGKQPKGNKFIIKKTPAVLQYVGIEPLEIELSTSVINKAKKTHKMTNDEILSTVRKLADPLLIFDSDKAVTENKKNSIILITDQQVLNDAESAAVSMNININEENSRYKINSITSIHGRGLIAKNGVNIMEEWQDKGLLKYVDDKKISSLAKAVSQSEPDIQEQFLLPLATLDITKVPCKTDFVNSSNIQKMAKSIDYDKDDYTNQIKMLEKLHKLKEEIPVVKGEIKSIRDNDFSGQNFKLTKDFQDELIEKGLVKPEEKFVLVNKNEAAAHGTKIKENSPYVVLTIPVKNEGKTEFVSTMYYHISALEEPQKIDKSFNKKKSVIEPGKTVISEFAMITANGVESFKDMIVSEYNSAEKMWTLNSRSFELIKTGDDGKTYRNNEEIPNGVKIIGEKKLYDKTIKITENTLNTLTSEEYSKKAAKYTQDTKTAEKMTDTQYNDFFELRDNCANNFRHNLSVLCRKEANSPLDALKAASSLISQMPKEEKQKTKELLTLLRKDGQTVNEVLIKTYHEAVKETPLNEDYIKHNRYEKMVARPVYDTLSTKGEKIDSDYNLKIGDSVDITFKVDKNPGSKFSLRKESIYQNCTIISASKEGNMVILMDGNKSFYEVPRDTFLKEYAHKQKIENKMEKKVHRQQSMQIDIGR